MAGGLIFPSTDEERRGEEVLGWGCTGAVIAVKYPRFVLVWIVSGPVGWSGDSNGWLDCVSRRRFHGEEDTL